MDVTTVKSHKKIILIVGILLGYTSVVNGTVSAPAGAD
jgi:hypothetical protein